MNWFCDLIFEVTERFLSITYGLHAVQPSKTFFSLTLPLSATLFFPFTHSALTYWMYYHSYCSKLEAMGRLKKNVGLRELNKYTLHYKKSDKVVSKAFSLDWWGNKTHIASLIMNQPDFFDIYKNEPRKNLL